MNQHIEYGRLFDFYKDLLSDRQVQVMEHYFINDLTMPEISEELGISKQAVSLTINKSIAKLEEFDKKLKYAELYEKYNILIDRLSVLYQNGETKTKKDILDDIYVLLSEFERVWLNVWKFKRKVTIYIS